MTYEQKIVSMFDDAVKNAVKDAKKHSNNYDDAMTWIYENVGVTSEPSKDELHDRTMMVARDFNRSVYYEALEKLKKEALGLPIHY